MIKENSKDSKPWWPPTVVPPKGAPNVLLIMTDDQVTASAALLAAQMRCEGLYHFDQYLIGRQYSATGRPPSFPYGFLFNLAVRSPDTAVLAADPACNWKEGVELARDIVAVLDVEPQNQFWMINPAPKRLDPLLREIGLYDHLFGLRQWSIYVTPLVLRSFVGTHYDHQLTKKHGWTLEEAAKLCEAAVVKVRTSPAKLSRSDLKCTGLSDAQLDRLLPHFMHPNGSVNAGYRSPLHAEAADLMFRPMVQGENDHFIVPAASFFGPAFYEATMGAVRAALSNSQISQLSGVGTEKVTEALFRFAGLPPTYTAEKYNVGKADAGECDLILEDHTHVVFVECKAKALTRATMSGRPGAALGDYVSGVLKAQAQCLRHERLLRTDGHILFESGHRIDYGNREIVRLSVTLLDHGTIQDAKTFWAFAAVLAVSKKSKLKKVAEEINSEVAWLEAQGRSVAMSVLSAASLSIGQLSIILQGAKNLEQFVKRINARATTNSGNPLLEFRYLRAQGLVP